VNDPKNGKQKSFGGKQVNGGKTYAVQSRDDHLNEYYGQCHFHYLINFLNFIIFFNNFFKRKIKIIMIDNFE